MNQRQLGQAVGVGLQQIHKYESGASRVSASRLWHIAAAMGCNVSYFFEGLDHGPGDAGQSPGQGDGGRATLPASV